MKPTYDLFVGRFLLYSGGDRVSFGIFGYGQDGWIVVFMVVESLEEIMVCPARTGVNLARPKLTKGHSSDAAEACAGRIDCFGTKTW